MCHQVHLTATFYVVVIKSKKYTQLNLILIFKNDSAEQSVLKLLVYNGVKMAIFYLIMLGLQPGFI
jgi:hypothetical protein